jgi:hypothetical protein
MLPYITILVLIGVAIYQQYVIKKHIRVSDKLKLDLLEQAKKVYKNEIELATIKGADDVRNKKLSDQLDYINDLMDEL